MKNVSTKQGAFLTKPNGEFEHGIIKWEKSVSRTKENTEDFKKWEEFIAQQLEFAIKGEPPSG